VYLGEIGFTSFRRRDVEDFACFVEGKAGAREGGGCGTALVRGGEFLRE